MRLLSFAVRVSGMLSVSNVWSEGKADFRGSLVTFLRSLVHFCHQLNETLCDARTTLFRAGAEHGIPVMTRKRDRGRGAGQGCYEHNAESQCALRRNAPAGSIIRGLECQQWKTALRRFSLLSWPCVVWPPHGTRNPVQSRDTCDLSATLPRRCLRCHRMHQAQDHLAENRPESPAPAI